MLLKRQEFREKRDVDTENENDLFYIRKSVSGAVLFIQKDHTVMLMNSGEVHKDRAVFEKKDFYTAKVPKNAVKWAFFGSVWCLGGV